LKSSAKPNKGYLYDAPTRDNTSPSAMSGKVVAKQGIIPSLQKKRYEYSAPTGWLFKVEGITVYLFSKFCESEQKRLSSGISYAYPL